MKYGHVEQPRQRVDHLLAIRDLQARCPEGKPGFLAFIPWIFRSTGTRLEAEGISTDFSPLEYIRIIAASRLILNNIPNIQASWLTVGRQTAQAALHSGANDMGSIMIEEHVVSSAGADNRFDAEGIQQAIREAGFTPRLRNQLYELRPWPLDATLRCGGGSRPTGIRAAETPADDVAEYQPRWQSHTVDSTQYRKVFLAGTIDMGRSSDWQAALVARFRDSIGGRWLFFNPRRREFHASPAEMEYQVAWELAHLEAADLIVMNLLGDSRSPISLLEMGLYARSGKLFVACSPDYYRYDNVRITCRRYGVPLYDSLTALLDDLPQQSDE